MREVVLLSVILSEKYLCSDGKVVNMVEWLREDLEDYHDVDQETGRIMLGDREGQMWWIIDKLDGKAFVWDELGVTDFESLREAFGIAPDTYGDVEEVDQSFLHDYLNEPGDQYEGPSSDDSESDDEKYRFDASEGWDWN